MINKKTAIRRGKTIINKIYILPDVISNILFMLSGVLCLAVGLLIFFSIVMRYFFASPIFGATEISTYMIYFTAFLAAPWIFIIDKHISIDIVKEYISDKKNKIILIINNVIIFVVATILFLRSVVLTYDHYVRGEIILDVFELQRYPFTAFVPVCFFLFMIIALKKIRNYFIELQRED